MKKKRFLWIMAGIGYIVFCLITGGIVIYVDKETYSFSYHNSSGAYFAGPYFVVDSKDIRIPFILSYMSRSSKNKISFNKWHCFKGEVNDVSGEIEPRSYPGEEHIVSVELSAVSYITRDGQQYNLLSLSYPQQHEFSLRENELTVRLPEQIQEGDMCKTEGRIYCKNGEKISFSSTYTVNKFPAKFYISLSIFTPPAA